MKAIDCIGLKQDQQDTLFKCIAAILHIGNLKFSKDEADDDKVVIQNPDGIFFPSSFKKMKKIIIQYINVNKF